VAENDNDNGESPKRTAVALLNRAFQEVTSAIVPPYVRL